MIGSLPPGLSPLIPTYTTSASDEQKATNVVMTNTKFNSLHPGRLNFGEFLPDNELKTIQSTSNINDPSPAFYLSPGPRVGKEAPDWNPTINGNNQAFATDLSDDTFLRMFDDIIQTPSPIAQDKQHEAVGSSLNIKTKNFSSGAATGSLKTEENSTKSMSQRQRDNSLAAFQIDTRPSGIQSNETSKVPSTNEPFKMENAPKPTNVDMNNAPGKRSSNSNTNAKTPKTKNTPPPLRHPPRPRPPPTPHPLPKESVERAPKRSSPPLNPSRPEKNTWKRTGAPHANVA
ncbi:hypothetical protein DID88_002598 [Monilinia fructigena]|uniref:Uncharacterized protein n=1 Tax=Monilinia fructigena TaxID=38457 RepID=A0A395IPA3_9HELO|nr:hypothetical protein DID88_002598 [Monilinia fructigena]